MPGRSNYSAYRGQFPSSEGRVSKNSTVFLLVPASPHSVFVPAFCNLLCGCRFVWGELTQDVLWSHIQLGPKLSAERDASVGLQGSCSTDKRNPRINQLRGRFGEPKCNRALHCRTSQKSAQCANGLCGSPRGDQTMQHFPGL